MVLKFSKLEEKIKSGERHSSVDILEMEAPPVHLGEVLREDLLKPLGLTQSQLAKELGISFRAINELVDEKRGISPEMAIRLAKRFGISPPFWLGFQMDYNLWKAAKKMKLADVG